MFRLQSFTGASLVYDPPSLALRNIKSVLKLTQQGDDDGKQWPY